MRLLLSASLLLLLSCSLFLDRPDAPSGPAVSFVGDTVRLALAAPPGEGPFGAQLRVGDSIRDWFDVVPESSQLLVRVTWTEPGPNVVYWRYRTRGGAASDWSRGLAVRVLPSPGYPCNRITTIGFGGPLQVVSDSGFRRVCVRTYSDLFVIDLPSLEPSTRRTLSGLKSIIATPDLDTLYASVNDTMILALRLDDLLPVDTFIPGIRWGQWVTSDGGLVLLGDSLWYYDLGERRAVNRLPLPFEDPVRLCRSSSGRIFIQKDWYSLVTEVDRHCRSVLGAWVLAGWEGAMAFDPKNDDLWFRSYLGEDSTAFSTVNGVTGRQCLAFVDDSDYETPIALSPCLPFLFHTSYYGDLRVTDTRTLTLHDERRLVGFPIAFSPDGELALYRHDDSLLLYSVWPDR